MTFDVIIGRSRKDVERYGRKGTVFVGKQYVKMGQTTSLSNPVYMDVAGAHVVFIVGKRGCLAGDTKIFTNHGYKEIKDFNPKNDKVYSYGSRGFEWENAQLLNYKIAGEELIRLENCDGRALVLTKEHKLLVSDGKKVFWREAKNLKKGDSLIAVSKVPRAENNKEILRTEKCKITRISRVKRVKEVYDLQVPKNNSFIANRIISHNSGKSYTMGAIAEGLADLPPEIKQNLSIVLLDTMGIYWTMKYPNFQDSDLLKSWGFEPKPLDVKIYTPSGFYYRYKDEGIPTDFPFSVRPLDVNPEDWCLVFSLNPNSAEGVLITKIVQELGKKSQSYDLSELINAIQEDEESDHVVKNVVVNQFKKAQGWEIFAKEGTALKDIVAPGQVTVLDVSPYATMASGWDIKGLVVGLICRTLFNQRMLSRKAEEFKTVDAAMHYFSKEVEEKMEEPLVWIAVDEAHELLPKEGTTAATRPLITILREGRQPGISLILASQQPGKIHTDVMTQSDTVIAHRLTARMDVEALGLLTQSYMRKGLEHEIDLLPRVKGSAVIFDDANERIFPVQMRPRFTWHGGGSPTAIKEKKEFFRKGLERLKEI